MAKNGTVEIKLPKPPSNIDFEMGAGVWLPAVAPLFTNFEAEYPKDFDDKFDDVMSKEVEIMNEVGPKMVQDLNQLLQDALQNPVWAWKEGSRNIFDTGKLANSGGAVWTGSGIYIEYKAPYANIVHNGGYVQPYGNPHARPVYLPGRPWIRATIEGGGPVPKFDAASYFQKR